MRIHHNIPALNTNRNLSNTNNSISKNLEKLSSGYRINRAGDDAAGLAISEKMRAQITGLTQAQKNAEDGVSLVQTVEGAMTEVHSMLNRMISLSVQSANGTYTKSERMMMDQELQNLKTEITRISKSTNFNGTKLFTQADSDSNRIAEYNMTLDLTARTCTINSVMFAGSASSGSTDGTKEPNAALADKIATEYFPNGISQIFDAFPTLAAAVGSDKIEMQLHIDNIDGSGDTLAYAQFSCYATGDAFNMLIKVDSSDFSDASIEDGSPDTEMLESTIAHELMHSVMQYTMTDEMSGRAGQEFPEWFKEGTAQLAGGGFPTNWNYELEQIANDLTSASDASKDTAITDYLKKYTVDGRPYGHGYLAAAYLGYLASGQTAITGANIAAGMDKIFDEIINNNKTLDQAIQDNTGLANSAALKQLFTNGDADLVEFVRGLAYEVTGTAGGVERDGAGSIITGSLSDGGIDILGSADVGDQAFSVNKIVIVNDGLASTDAMQLMVGETGIDANQIQIKIFQLDNQSLNLANTDILTAEKAKAAIDTVNTAIDKVSSVRSYYGAIQNRLEHTINNLGSTTENLTAAESRIRDTDMAKAMMDFTRNQILLQSGQSMLAHANMVPQSVLTLLNA